MNVLFTMKNSENGSAERCNTSIILMRVKIAHQKAFRFTYLWFLPFKKKALHA